jgi:23S rRNA A2030 N6-methylase RlmJ
MNDNNMTHSITFEKALEAYVKKVQEINDDYYAVNYPGSTVVVSPLIVTEEGPKKVRIIKQDKIGNGRTVHTFIDKATGDILKAAGWKAPAPNGKRGNIYDADFSKCITQFGAEYLR